MLASVVLDVIRCGAIKLSLVGTSAKVFPARQPGHKHISATYTTSSIKISAYPAKI